METVNHYEVEIINSVLSFVYIAGTLADARAMAHKSRVFVIRHVTTNEIGVEYKNTVERSNA